MCTWKAEADGSLRTGDQPGLQIQASQGYTERPCFEKPKKYIYLFLLMHMSECSACLSGTHGGSQIPGTEVHQL